MIQKHLKQLLIKLLQPILIVQQSIIIGRKMVQLDKVIMVMETATDVGSLEVNLIVWKGKQLRV